MTLGHLLCFLLVLSSVCVCACTLILTKAPIVLRPLVPTLQQGVTSKLCVPTTAFLVQIWLGNTRVDEEWRMKSSSLSLSAIQNGSELSMWTLKAALSSVSKVDFHDSAEVNHRKLHGYIYPNTPVAGHSFPLTRRFSSDRWYFNKWKGKRETQRRKILAELYNSWINWIGWSASLRFS